MTIEIYTGGAGVGKSFELDRQRTEAGSDGCLTVAPTGVAALLVRGMTPHKAFSLPTSLIGENDIMASPLRNKWNGIKTLFIDEMGMMRADITHGANLFLQRTRRNDEPFGGVKVIMFGDPFQLPPILKKEDEAVFKQMGYKSKWSFDLPYMQDAKVNLMTTCYRQTDLAFIKALNEIRTGDLSVDTLDVINSRVGATLDSPFITLAAYNKEVDAVNDLKYRQIQGVERGYDAIVKEPKGVKFDDKDCLSPRELWLKVGCQVMMTKNDLGGRWVNGDMAVVTKLGNKTVEVELKGVKHIVDSAIWEKVDTAYNPVTKKTKTEVVATFEQLPLRLAYAITIHKSQGQTLRQCRIQLDSRPLYTPGQLYTALSRPDRLEAFSLSRPITGHDVNVDRDVRRWYESIAG